MGDRGFFQGYNYRVVAVIAMTAFGGLLCAVMLKYAGATHGCFSTAMSIVLTSWMSKAFLGDFSSDMLFGVGTTLTIAASLLFALGWPTGPAQLLENSCAFLFNSKSVLDFGISRNSSAKL